jgi:DNA-binding MurR/RpiR family transcriptional regulator
LKSLSQDEAMQKSISRENVIRGLPSFGERIGHLSVKRQELMRPIQERPRDYVLLSIRDVAQKLGTDPATVLRIVRSMGFPSYREFKLYIHELSIAGATSLEGMRAIPPADSGLTSHVRKALDQDLQNLHTLRNTLDLDRVVKLAERIYKARRILLIGGDMTVSLIDFLDYKLTLLGLPVFTAITPGKTLHAVRGLTKKDLVIAISFRRGLRQTVEGLQQARANGAYCIGIADTFVSPIARFAHECFLTSVEAPFSNSYTAPMSLLHVLFTVCAHYRRARTLAVLEKVDYEQRHGFRWYMG